MWYVSWFMLNNHLLSQLCCKVYYNYFIFLWSFAKVKVTEYIQTTVVILFQLYACIFLCVNFISLGPKSLVHWTGSSIYLNFFVSLFISKDNSIIWYPIVYLDLTDTGNWWKWLRGLFFFPLSLVMSFQQNEIIAGHFFSKILCQAVMGPVGLYSKLT